MGSLLGGTVLNYVGHRACVYGDGTGARKERKYVEMAELDKQNDLAGVQEKDRLHRATRNWAWLSNIINCRNGT